MQYKTVSCLFIVFNLCDIINSFFNVSIILQTLSVQISQDRFVKIYSFMLCAACT